MDRGRADYMGMLGTVMNALALQDFLEQAGAATRGAVRDLDDAGRRALHPRGAPSATSRRAASSSSAPAPACPYFSTDTVAAQRALEIGADEVLVAKNGVDGVYTATRARTRTRHASSTRITYQRGAPARPQGRGLDGVQPLHGQRHADDGVRHGAERATSPRRSSGETIGTLVTA